MHSYYAGTLKLLKLNLWRDYLKISLWLLGLVSLVAGAAMKFNGLYGTKATMASIITTLKTPAMVALLGPFTANKSYTVATIYASEMMVFMGLFVAMMNIYFAIHLTRADEDNGILELIRSHAIGRSSTLVAAILQLIIINVLMGILEVTGLQISGMQGASLAGNLLFGFGLSAFGLMFGSFSLFFAQIANSARTSTILSYLWLGLLFISRSMTDIQNPTYTWYTIYGWIEKFKVYDENIWTPIILIIAMTILVFVFAIWITKIRDVGAGILPERAGRPQASVFLRDPFSLIVRLEHNSTLIWITGLFILGIIYGSIFGTAGNLLNSNPTMAKLIGNSATNMANRMVVLNFANKLSLIFVILATIPGLLVIFRLNTDEKKGYFEQLHARSLSRLNLYLTLVLYGLLTALIIFFSGMLGMTISGIISMDGIAPSFTHLMRGFWGFAPSLVVTFGFAAMFTGILPRWQNIAWLLPVYGLFSLYIGPLMNLPKWATQLTPFGWINNVPVQDVSWNTTIWMVALGILMIIIGYFAYNHRDLLEN